MATTVTASVPATALSSTALPWRNHIYTMNDSARVTLYTDGTNLVYKISTNGQTWSAATTAVAGVTSIGLLLDAVVVGNNLLIFKASGTSITCTRLVYAPATQTFGSPSTITLLSSLTYTPVALRSLYDSAGTTNDSQHTAGTTGITHLVVDAGSTWHLYALDLNTTATNKPKVVLSGVVNTGISSPTYATNAILRISGNPAKLYAISPDATKWNAWEIIYGSTTTTSGSTSSGSSTYAYAGSGWLYSFFGSPQTGTAFAAGTYQDAAQLTPTGGPTISTSPGSTGERKLSLGDVSGSVFPTGTWTWHTLLHGGVSGRTTAASNVTIGAAVYTLTGGVYTLRGTLGTSTPGTLTDGGLLALTSTGTIVGFTCPANTTLVIVPYLHFPSGAQLTISGTSGTAQMTEDTRSLTTTTPTTPTPTTTTTYSYTVGGIENPALTLSSQGAALCRSDISNNPGIDILANIGTNVVSITRNSTGTYSAQTTITSTGFAITPSTGVAVAQNVKTGAESAFVLGTPTGGVQQVLCAQKSGTWGGWAIIGTPSLTAVQNDFCSIWPFGLADAGNAVLYINAPTTHPLIYEDAGFGTGNIAPPAPSSVILLPGGTTTTVFGSATPFNVLLSDPTPYIQWAYTYTNNTNAMGAYRIVVTRTDTGPTTVWDSGRVGVVTGPTNGGLYKVKYGTTGASATALVAGATYSVQVYVYDSISGQVSAASAAITFYVDSDPVISITDPTTSLVSSTPTFTFTQTQAESLAGQAWTASLTDPATSTVVWTSGQQTGTITSGTPFTTPSQDLSGRGLKNDQSYVLTIGVYITPPGGTPVFVSTTEALTVSIPTSPAPTTLTATPVPGTTPLAGGYVQLDWLQDGSSPVAVQNNVYQRVYSPTTILPWVLIGSVPVPSFTGTNTLLAYSVANTTAYDFAVTAVDAAGIESGYTVVSNISFTFRVGMWFCNADDPSECLELGMRDGSSSTMPKWEAQQEKDFANLFNRVLPVLTVGTTYAYHMPAIVFALEDGFEQACWTLLRKWDQQGTTLQIRDMWGNVFFGSFVAVNATASTVIFVQAAEVEIMQTDPGDRPVALSALIGS